MAIRVFVVDDQPLFTDGLRQFLAREPDMELVGESADAEMALTGAGGVRPDVVLLNTDAHRGSGGSRDALSLTRALTALAPRVRVVMLSSRLDAGAIETVVRSGVGACLLRSCSHDELRAAIRAVHNDRTYLCQDATAVLMASWKNRDAAVPATAAARLSARENEVLVLVAQGLRTKAIADKLRVGHKTIATHRSRIMRKLGCASTADLVRFAIRNGLATP